ncbi:MAG: ABC transporter ATP-binding protein [Acidimicrobiales bacterium]
MTLVLNSVGGQLVVAGVMVAGRVLCQLAASWLSASAAGTVQHRLRTDLIASFDAATWEVQSNEREGRFQQLAGQEVYRATGAIVAFNALITAGCNLAMLIAIAVVVSPAAAAAAFVAIAILYFALRPVTRRGHGHATVVGLGELDIAQTLNEAVRTAEETRVFGVGAAQRQIVDRQAEAVADSSARVNFLSLSIATAYQSAALGLIIMALAVVNAIRPSNLDALGAMVLILLRAFAYSQQAQTLNHRVHELAPAARAVIDQIELYRTQPAPAGNERISDVAALRCEGVSYRYGRGGLALDALSFDVIPGETVGVIGPSGAGKSTLVQILLRLRYPTSGQFIVNGRIATEYLAEDWARLISYVPQEPNLVAGTVEENIRFFRDEISADTVVKAGRDAHIHDEIVAWPKGYQTVVGQRADGVSGGQRQRLCLARALAGSPALLVLDEPTSALDLRSESLIQESLRELRGRTTMFIIAHRMSTLNLCDRLLVLDHGRVEAFAAPTELTARGGFYTEALQLSGLA